LERSAGFLARLAQIRLFEAFYERFGAEGLQPGEFTVLLAILENPGVRQGVLADGLMIKWSNMAKMVRSLEERDLVRRAVPADDRRAVELRLTQAAEALVLRLRPEMLAHDREATAMLTDAEHATLVRLLRKVAGRPVAAGNGANGTDSSGTETRGTADAPAALEGRKR